MSIALLLSVRITSEICSSTATLDDKNNRSSDALLSENWSNSQETGSEFIFDGLRGIYSACHGMSYIISILCNNCKALIRTLHINCTLFMILISHLNSKARIPNGTRQKWHSEQDSKAVRDVRADS